MTYEKRLAKAMHALLSGLLYPGSEGDSPYFSVCVPISDIDATAESLRQDLHLAKWWKLDLRDGFKFFSNITDNPDIEYGDSCAYETVRSLMEQFTGEEPLFHLVAAPPDGHYHDTRHFVGAKINKHFVGIVTYSVET